MVVVSTCVLEGVDVIIDCADVRMGVVRRTRVSESFGRRAESIVVE